MSIKRESPLEIIKFLSDDDRSIKMKLIIVLLLVGIVAVVIPETSSASLSSGSDFLTERKHHSHESDSGSGSDESGDKKKGPGKEGPGPKGSGEKGPGPKGPEPKKPKGPHSQESNESDSGSHESGDKKGPGPKGSGEKGPGPKGPDPKKPKGPHSHESNESGSGSHEGPKGPGHEHSHEHSHEHKHSHEHDASGSGSDSGSVEYESEISAPAGIFVVFERLVVEFRTTIEVYVQDYAKANSVQVDAVLVQFRSILATFEINVKQTIARACESRTDITIVKQQIQTLFVELRSTTVTIISRACASDTDLIYQINTSFTSFNVSIEKYIVTDVSQYTTSVTITTTTQQHQQEQHQVSERPVHETSSVDSSNSAILVIFEKLFVELQNTIEVYVQDYASTNKVKLDSAIIQFRSVLESFEIDAKALILGACESRIEINVAVQQIKALIVDFQKTTVAIFNRSNSLNNSLIVQINTYFEYFNVNIIKYVVKIVSEITGSISTQTNQKETTIITEVTDRSEEALSYLIVIVEKILTEVNIKITAYVKAACSQSTVSIDVSGVLAQTQSAFESFQAKFKRTLINAVRAKSSLSVVTQQIEVIIVEYQTNISKISYTLGKNLSVTSLNNQLKIVFNTLTVTIEQFLVNLCGGSTKAKLSSVIDLSGGISAILSAVKSLVAGLGSSVNSLLTSLGGSSSSSTWTTTSTKSSSGGTKGLLGSVGGLLGSTVNGLGGIINAIV